MKNQLFMIRFEMDLTRYSRERVVYGFLDLLGDAGGFFDALVLLSTIILSIFSFQSLNLFLVSKLFNYREKDGELDPGEMLSIETMELGWLSLLKLTVLQHCCCKINGLYSKRERAYF